jgi:hypothetical protein
LSKAYHNISELAKWDKCGRTKIYEEIAAGKLRAKKRGRNTIVLDEDWLEYLRNLPDAVASGAIRAVSRREAP